MKTISRVIVCLFILIILYVIGAVHNSRPILGVVLIAALSGFIPALIAHHKGHNFALWWFYGFIIWIVAVIHAMAISPTQEYLDKQIDADPTLKRCPYCGEGIKSIAIICKYCHMDLRNFHPTKLTKNEK